LFVFFCYGSTKGSRAKINTTTKKIPKVTSTKDVRRKGSGSINFGGRTEVPCGELPFPELTNRKEKKMKRRKKERKCPDQTLAAAAETQSDLAACQN